MARTTLRSDEHSFTIQVDMESETIWWDGTEQDVEDFEESLAFLWGSSFEAV